MAPALLGGHYRPPLKAAKDPGGASRGAFTDRLSGAPFRCLLLIDANGQDIVLTRASLSAIRKGGFAGLLDLLATMTIVTSKEQIAAGVDAVECSSTHRHGWLPPADGPELPRLAQAPADRVLRAIAEEHPDALYFRPAPTRTAARRDAGDDPRRT